MNEVQEKLAEYAHEAWSGWMKYLFSKSDIAIDGRVIIPPELAIRWKTQMNTPYKDLPEEEKQTDRFEADKILAMLDEV